MAITKFPANSKQNYRAFYEFHQRFAPDYADATTLFERRQPPAAGAANGDLDMLTTTSGGVALPTDYLAWRTALWTGRIAVFELDYVHPAYLQSTVAARDVIRSCSPSRAAALRRVRSTIADAYEFHYYQKIPTARRQRQQDQLAIDRISRCLPVRR